MSKYRYVAYGSNLHPLRLQKRVSTAKLLGTSTLTGYELRFNKKSDVDGSGKCSLNIADSFVYVAVFEISVSEKPNLDKIEGLGKGYDQKSIQLEEYGTCLTYIANPRVIDETILPMDWYKEMVMLGCLSNRFPKEYVSYVESVDSIEDPQRTRARANWKLIEELRKVA